MYSENTNSTLKWIQSTSGDKGANGIGQFSAALASDVGKYRNENQDKVALIYKPQSGKIGSVLVGVVCDGMGGMQDGDLAASIAISKFTDEIIGLDVNSCDELLVKAATRANNEVHNYFNGKGGATLTAFAINSAQQFSAINIGDSRIYLANDHVAEQYSVDDTLAGQLGKSEHSSTLLQFVGIGKDIEITPIELPDINYVNKVMLCSDGIHYINRDTLFSMMLENTSSSELCRRFINIAAWCGGKDNASILVVNDIANLHQKFKEQDTGVSVWTPFSQLQIIEVVVNRNDIEAPSPDTTRQNSKLQHLDKLINSDLEDEELFKLIKEIKEISTKLESSSIKPATKIRRAKSTKAKKDRGSSDVPKKPQLRIDFDNESD